MKAWNDFQAKKSGSTREILPAGGYVCEIKTAKVEEYNSSKGSYSFLVIALEVIEGEYKGFWKKDFDNNTNEDKKWRGTLRLSIPKDDGSDMDNWTKRTFGNFIWAIQESNSGYTWDWDEKKLKGKKLGVLYRDREWELDGRTGWTTEACGAISVEECRENKFKMPKPKALKNRPQTEQAKVEDVVESEDDLPF